MEIINKNIINIENECIKACISFCEKNSILNLTNGSYEICGNDIYCNVFEYDTHGVSNNDWELHREYIDLHLIISGNEKIGYSKKAEKCGPYNKEKDFSLCSVKDKNFVLMQDGDGFFILPNCPHLPGISKNQSSHIKKAVFKIKWKTYLNYELNQKTAD